MEAVHKEKYKGHKIRIYQDPDPMSPDDWGDDNLLLVHYHRQFLVTRDQIITEDDAREFYQGETIEQSSRYWIFPVAAYIHGAVALSVGQGGHFPDQRWDVSHVGLVLAAREEWPEEDKARAAAEAHIEEWNLHLSGQVYGFVIKRKGEEIASCWGFAGPLDSEYSALTEARAEIDGILRNRKPEQNNPVLDRVEQEFTPDQC